MPCRRFQTVGGAEVFVLLVWHLGNDNELYQSTEASSYAAKTVARSQGTLARPVAAIQEQRSLGVCLRSAGMDVDTKPERIPAVNLKHRLIEVKHQIQPRSQEAEVVEPGNCDLENHSSGGSAVRVSDV